MGTLAPSQKGQPLPATDGFRCTICSLDFAEKDQLVQHAMDHQEVEVFLCHWCGKLIAHLAEIVRHLQQHSETTMCILCCGLLPTFQYLSDHLDQHAEAGLVHCCSDCGLIFVNQDAILRHMNDNHNGDLQQEAGHE